MKWNLRWRLSLMMFLQFAIWGAWVVWLPFYLHNGLGFEWPPILAIFSLMPLACMISPFIGGQIADRWVPSQWFMAVSNMACGVLMLIMGTQEAFHPLYWLMLVFSLFYAPTLAVANSICFHHLADTEKEFPFIRVWGSIGWIVALLILAFWLYLLGGDPAKKGQVCLYLAGIFALGLGVLSIFLPHTPPAKKKEKPWAFVEALKLMKDWRIAAFILIGLVVATQLQFYYGMVATFLAEKEIVASKAIYAIPAWTTLAQAVEALVMLSLPFMLLKLGYRKALAIGVIAWPIRYIIFAIGAPKWLVLASLGLHGFCYVYFFVVGMIYINSVAPSDIRASAQSLWVFATFGVGLFIGSYFTGWIGDLFTKVNEAGGSETNYTAVFLVPVFLTVACAVAYMTIFREMPKLEEETVEGQGEPEEAQDSAASEEDHEESQQPEQG